MTTTDRIETIKSLEKSGWAEKTEFVPCTTCDEQGEELIGGVCPSGQDDFYVLCSDCEGNGYVPNED